MHQRYVVASPLRELYGLMAPRSVIFPPYPITRFNYTRSMRRYVSSSCVTTTRVNHGRFPLHPLNPVNLISIQKRSYIFLPSNFAEFLRILRNSCSPLSKISSSSEEPRSSFKLFIRLRRSKEQILIKLQQAMKILSKSPPSTFHHDQALASKSTVSIIPKPSSSSSFYHRFSQWKGTKKQRVRDWIQTQRTLLATKKVPQQVFMSRVKVRQQRLSYNWKQIYDSLVKKSLSMEPSLTTDSLVHVKSLEQDNTSMKQMSYSYYKRKLRSLGLLLSHPKLVLYSQQLFTLTEPFEPSWFDADGYPLTSQDPYSLRYVNPWMSLSSNGWKSLRDVWKWKKDRIMDLRTQPPPTHGDESIDNNSNTMVVPRPIPRHEINIHPPMDHEDLTIKLTWIGHATCLVHISNQFTILTDPIFSNKASPFQSFTKREFFGVPRYFPPALSLWDDDKQVDSDDHDHHVPHLPSVIDVCLISHDHYDHLDYSSIVQLVDRVKLWVVPLGIKQWFLQNIPGMDMSSIVELKWWDRITLTRKVSTRGDNDIMILENKNDIKYNEGSYTENSSMDITCAPAQHWCSRTPWDRNTRLWCSWAVHSWIPPQSHPSLENKTSSSSSSYKRRLAFFFTGDTARPETFPLHRQIGDRLGPFDLSAIPIGAYEPRFFMKDSHCNPEEAVQVHQDLRSRKSVAIHWGTFPLANEPYWDPAIRLYKAVTRFSRDHEQSIDFTAIGIGQSIESSTNDNSLEILQIINRQESTKPSQDMPSEPLDDDQDQGRKFSKNEE